jgi:glycosyltransferase involved in cell wall biosynthesis
MSALNVIVLSSSSPEPFGRVVIDGMAAGRPVVATAAGGVLEIIEDGVNGLLVPPRDSKAIADAVLELLCNRAKAQEIGRAARRRVEEQFTLQRHVASIQQVYDTVLVNAGRSSANRKYQNANGAASLEILPGAESDDSREAIRTSCE